MSEKLTDKTGMKFGRLTVMHREGTYQRPSGNKEATWRCKCECGNEVVVLGSNLKKKNTLSCGCLQRENRLNSRRETEYEIREDVVYVKSFDGTEFVVNVCDLDYVLAHRWHSNGHGYMANEHGKTIHRALMKPPAAMDVHHINGNKLDNRRSNLLMMSRAEHSALHKGVSLANGVTIQKWIPVTERLPERNDDGTVNAVLVTNGSVQHIAYLAKDIFHFTENGEMKEPMFYEVTHWMPLPEPPKGVE